MLLDRPTGVTGKDVPSLRLMSSSTAPLTPADFEALFAPFDLWAFVDSAPVAPADPNQPEPTPSDE